MGNTAYTYRDTIETTSQLIFRDFSAHKIFQALEQKFLEYDIQFELQSSQIMCSFVI